MATKTERFMRSPAPEEQIEFDAEEKQSLLAAYAAVVTVSPAPGEHNLFDFRRKSNKIIQEKCFWDLINLY